MKICHVLIASFLLFFVLGLVSGEQSALEKKFLKSRVNTPDEADIDNEEETHMEIINQKKVLGYMLYVEIEGQDNDGYKPSQFFQINYCPMCGRKLGG